MMRVMQQHARTQFLLVVARHSAKRCLRLGIYFWAFWLVLVALEATLGSSQLIGAALFVSIPLLVATLIWANHTVLLMVESRFTGMFLLGVTVLFSASMVTAVGIAATASLKNLLTA